MSTANLDIALHDLDHLRLALWDELAAERAMSDSAIMRTLDAVFDRPVRFLRELLQADARRQGPVT